VSKWDVAWSAVAIVLPLVTIVAAVPWPDDRGRESGQRRIAVDIATGFAVRCIRRSALMIAAHVQTVQCRLGHKSATMTLDNYGHPFGDLDDVADRMGPGFRPAAANAAVRCGQNVGTRPHLRVLGA
jgi:hypothetical protein